MLHFLTRLFGSRNERLVRSYGRYVRAAAELEPSIQRLSDAELRGKTDEFRRRLKEGVTLDDLLPEAFAVVREAAQRTLKMRHFRCAAHRRHGVEQGDDRRDAHGRG